jgi:hypothetical protein
MDGTSSTHGEVEKFVKNLVEESEGKIPLGKLDADEDNSTIYRIIQKEV